MRAQQETSQARIFGSVIVVAVIGYACWRVLLPFLGGIAWAVRNADADVTPNIKQVAPDCMQLPPPNPPAP